MTLETLISKINYAIRGIDDDAPTSGTDEWNQWVSVYNDMKDMLYYNVGKNWSIIHKTTRPNEPGTVTTAGTTALVGSGTNFTDYNAGDTIVVSGETVRTIDTITDDTNLTVTSAFSTSSSSLTFTRNIIIATGTTRYNMHRSFLAPSSDVEVTKTDGNIVEYDIIPHQEANRNVREVYFEGDKPMTAVFTDTISSSDGIVGGTLNIAGYYLPDDVSAASDIIEIPDPNWAVMACAAEIAFNDIVYEEKAVDLNAKANSLFRQMMNRNRRGTYKNPRQTPVAVKRIRGV